jgi:hypothetical protein
LGYTVRLKGKKKQTKLQKISSQELHIFRKQEKKKKRQAKPKTARRREGKIEKK